MSLYFPIEGTSVLIPTPRCRCIDTHTPRVAAVTDERDGESKRWVGREVGSVERDDMEDQKTPDTDASGEKVRQERRTTKR